MKLRDEGQISHGSYGVWTVLRRQRRQAGQPRQRERKFRGNVVQLKDAVLAAAVAYVGARKDCRSFSAEEIAETIGATTAQVKHALHFLNLDGVVSQAKRCFAHDSTRAPFFYGPKSGWASNEYELRIVSS